MFFTHNGINYKIWFSHIVMNPKTGKGGVTICLIGTRKDRNENITTNQSFSIVYEAAAYCHSSDRFVKETGRKLSLERACHKQNDKEFTRLAFETYFNRKNK